MTTTVGQLIERRRCESRFLVLLPRPRLRSSPIGPRAQKVARRRPARQRRREVRRRARNPAARSSTAWPYGRDRVYTSDRIAAPSSPADRGADPGSARPKPSLPWPGVPTRGRVSSPTILGSLGGSGGRWTRNGPGTECITSSCAEGTKSDVGVTRSMTLLLAWRRCRHQQLRGLANVAGRQPGRFVTAVSSGVPGSDDSCRRGQYLQHQGHRQRLRSPPCGPYSAFPDLPPFPRANLEAPASTIGVLPPGAP